MKPFASMAFLSMCSAAMSSDSGRSRMVEMTPSLPGVLAGVLGGSILGVSGTSQVGSPRELDRGLVRPVPCDWNGSAASARTVMSRGGNYYTVEITGVAVDRVDGILNNGVGDRVAVRWSAATGEFTELTVDTDVVAKASYAIRHKQVVSEAASHASFDADETRVGRSGIRYPVDVARVQR